MHLRALPAEELWARLKPFLTAANVHCPTDMNWVGRALDVFKSYMETLVDGVNLFKYTDDNHFTMSDEGRETLTWETSKAVLTEWKKGLAAQKDFMTTEEFEALQNSIKDLAKVKGKQLFMPIRVAVIGQPHGAELKMLVPLIHKNSLLKRVDICLEKM